MGSLHLLRSVASLSLIASLAAAAACSSVAAPSTGNSAGGSDAGAGSDATDTTGDDPLNADPTCTSGTKWKNGDRGSSSMHPGGACITCHDKNADAPEFFFAGTVYPTGHEPNDCNAKVPSGLKVQMVDANGKVIVSATVNSVGNFYATSRAGTSIPKGAKMQVVTADGKTRTMDDTPKNGDCNSCHTQDGANDAPGRITVPQ